MKCKKCGAEIEPGSKFCTECGTPVEENSVKQESGFKQDTHEEKLVKKAKYHYGFSYVRIFRILWAILAIILAVGGIAVFLTLIHEAESYGANINGMVSVLSVLGPILNGLLVYWLGMFSVKRFENIAISAKMLTDIRNKLFDDSGKLKK